jgi:hypothetical protein
MYDVMNTVLMISQILMYFGLTNSIQRAFKAQREQKRKNTRSDQNVTSINDDIHMSLFIDTNTEIGTSSKDASRHHRTQFVEFK